MNIIEVVDLKKEYGSLIAVNGISFSVSRGEIFAFLGPNGAGKSTTIKMLTTLLKPTSGKMLINGKDPVTSKSSGIGNSDFSKKLWLHRYRASTSWSAGLWAGQP